MANETYLFNKQFKQIFQNYVGSNPKKIIRISHFKSNYFLKTKRLNFSFWQPKDLPLALSLWGDPAVTQFISTNGMTNEIVEQRLRFEMSHREDYNVQYWPVFLLETGEFIGCCGLHAFDESNPGYLEEGIYELGFHLKAAYWGKGYAREAAEVVIDYGFNTLQLKAIFAGHHPENHSSARLLNKLGFELSGNVNYPPTGLMHPSYLLLKPTEKG